jgi:hypothetical protein
MNVKKSNLDVGKKSIPIEVDKNKHENKIEKILNSKVNRVRKCFKEMVTHSTIHALPKIIKADKFYFKIMWILFFIISFGFNLQLVAKCITDYLLYETITKIDIGSEQPGNLIYLKLYIVLSGL